MKRVSNEDVIAAYRQTGSIWKAGKLVGLAGQSVHERLVALNHPMACRRWTNEERDELAQLVANGVTAGDAARRLGRTFGAVTQQLYQMGITNYRAPRMKKIPRGAGYDKASVHRHLRALEQSDVPLMQYCRANSLDIDTFVNAAQRQFPERWDPIVAVRSPLPKKQCPNCLNTFHPSTGKQTYCTRVCTNRARSDRQYFGGKRMTAIGMNEGVCQLCGRQGHRRLTPHHVIGKENDPDNDVMVALCSGCHQIITLLGSRKFIDDPAALQTMVTLAWLRLHGPDDLTGKELYVEVNLVLDDVEDEDVDEEEDEDVDEEEAV